MVSMKDEDFFVTLLFLLALNEHDKKQEVRGYFSLHKWTLIGFGLSLY